MIIRLLNNIKGNINKAGLSIFLLLLLHENIASTYNVSSNYVEIKGWVIKDNKPLPNTDIIILENDTIVYQMKSNFSGAFSLIVPFQKEYIFAFSKRELITKKVFIYTKTSSDINPSNYYDFHFEVELFEDSPYLNKDFFNYPVSMVFYDEKIDEFNYFKANLDQLASGDKNIFKGLLEKDFQYPESFLEYVQIIMDEEKSRQENSTQQPLVINEQGNDTDTMEIIASEPDTTLIISAIQEDIPIQETFLTAVGSSLSEPQTEYDISIPNHNTAIETGNPSNQNDSLLILNESSIPINFKNYFTPGNIPVIPGDVFFSIQILATKKRIPECFFCKLQESLPEKEIYYYHDKDSLDKFIVDTYHDLDTTLKNFWQIRRLGYEAYVVAFHNKERIRVKEAKALLHNLDVKP